MRKLRRMILLANRCLALRLHRFRRNRTTAGASTVLPLGFHYRLVRQCPSPEAARCWQASSGTHVTRSHALSRNGRSAARRRFWTRSVRGWRSHAERRTEKTLAVRESPDPALIWTEGLPASVFVFRNVGRPAVGKTARSGDLRRAVLASQQRGGRRPLRQALRQVVA